MRRAVCTGPHATVDQVTALLPWNYRVAEINAEGWPVIEGEDQMGWTLDDYVIPRLASGLIGCEEITTERSTP